MGGMAAQIPIRNDAAANAVGAGRACGKTNCARSGPGTTARGWRIRGWWRWRKSAFDTYMPGPNQIGRVKSSPAAASDLLCPPAGPITEAGLDRNLDVALQYLASWLDGNGCVPIYNLMEDAATAEICRAQVWQWARHGAKLEDWPRRHPGNGRQHPGSACGKTTRADPGGSGC